MAQFSRNIRAATRRLVHDLVGLCLAAAPRPERAQALCRWRGFVRAQTSSNARQYHLRQTERWRLELAGQDCSSTVAAEDCRIGHVAASCRCSSATTASPPASRAKATSGFRPTDHDPETCGCNYDCCRGCRAEAGCRKTAIERVHDHIPEECPNEQTCHRHHAERHDCAVALCRRLLWPHLHLRSGLLALRPWRRNAAVQSLSAQFSLIS